MALEKMSDYDGYNDMMPSELPLGEILIQNQDEEQPEKLETVKNDL